jgi:hypothetical protein
MGGNAAKMAVFVIVAIVITVGAIAVAGFLGGGF